MNTENDPKREVLVEEVRREVRQELEKELDKRDDRLLANVVTYLIVLALFMSGWHWGVPELPPEIALGLRRVAHFLFWPALFLGTMHVGIVFLIRPPNAVAVGLRTAFGAALITAAYLL